MDLTQLKNLSIGDPLASVADWESKWTITKDPKTQYIYFDPKGKHENTIIFLHGFSGHSTDFEESFKKGEAPASTRIILPQAPLRYNKIWGGGMKNSWWQMDCIPTIHQLNDLGRCYHQNDIIETTNMFLNIIEEERLKFPDGDSKRIFMGGMSQGAKTSLATLMRYPGPTPLGGFIIESGMFILEPQNINKDTSALKSQGETPIMFYHGDADKTLNIDMVIASDKYVPDVVYKDTPQNYSFTIEHGMGHTVSHKEWLQV